MKEVKEEQINVVCDKPVIVSIGIPLGAPPSCEEHEEFVKHDCDSECPQAQRTLSSIVHGLFCSSWIRYIFILLDLILTLAIVYRTKLCQEIPRIETEERHELKVIGMKQIASLQAELVVKMILCNIFQQTKIHDRNIGSLALWYWCGYILFSFSIQALVFLEVLKQISSLNV